VPGHEGPPRGEKFEEDRLNRHSPEVTPSRQPPDPDDPRVKQLGDRALRAAQQPQRTPPPQRQAPGQRDRVARDVGRTALRDTVERPPDREP
jgi:hypothetical protein